MDFLVARGLSLLHHYQASGIAQTLANVSFVLRLNPLHAFGNKVRFGHDILDVFEMMKALACRFETIIAPDPFNCVPFLDLVRMVLVFVRLFHTANQAGTATFPYLQFWDDLNIGTFYFGQFPLVSLNASGRPDAAAEGVHQACF